MNTVCYFCNKRFDEKELNSLVELSCQHSICNVCLSRQLLLKKFSQLLKSNDVTIRCRCDAVSSISFEKCSHLVASLQEQVVNKKVNRPFSKCFFHKDCNKNYFCKNCNETICSECAVTDTHRNHATFSLKEYKRIIKTKKNFFKFRSYDDIEKFINVREGQIVKKFVSQTISMKKMVDESIEILNSLKQNFLNKMSDNLKKTKAFFNIVRGVYGNYFNEMNDETNTVDMSSLDFLSQIKTEIQDINFEVFNNEPVESSFNALKKINGKKMFDIGFSFRKLTYENIATFSTEEQICVMSLLPRVQCFACGYNSGNISLYKVPEYGKVDSSHSDVKAHTLSVNALIPISFSTNNNVNLASGSSDKSIKLWSVEYDSNYTIASNRTSSNTITSNRKSDIKIRCLYTIDTIHLKSVLSLCELPDGRIASSSSDNTIKVFNPINVKESEIITLNDSTSFESCIIPIDDEVIASGSGDGRIKLWDIAYGGQLTKFFIGHSGFVSCMVKVSRKEFISGGDDAKVILWNLTDDYKSKILYGHRGRVEQVCLLSHNQCVSSSTDRTMRIWDYVNLTCIYVFNFKSVKNEIMYGLIADKRKIICGGNSSQIYFFNTDYENDNASNVREDEEEDKDEDEYYNDFL